MAQTPCTFRQTGDFLDYEPGAAVVAGTVVLLGTTAVTIVPVSFAATDKGARAVGGVWNVPKDNSDVAEGDALYWDADGDPVGGDAGSGAFTKTATGNIFAGIAVEAAGTSVGDVDMWLRSIDGTVPGALSPVPVATVAAANSAQNNGAAITTLGFTDVTGADNTKAVVLPEASTGRVVTLRNVTTDKILKVFPAVNDQINAASANSVYNQAAGTIRSYYAFNAVTWFTSPDNT